MDLNELAHKLDLIKTHRARLRVLELQEAQFGIHVPPQVITEIAEITRKITDFEQEIDSQPETIKEILKPFYGGSNLRCQYCYVGIDGSKMEVSGTNAEEVLRVAKEMRKYMYGRHRPHYISKNVKNESSE